MKDPQATRNQLLEAAAKVVYRKGFKAASLTDILIDTDLTKGALYHHFPNKQALGLALLDKIEEAVEHLWLQPLSTCSDPLDCLQSTLQSAVSQLTQDEVVLGCPLNNLAQEMSALDECFRLRIAAIYQKWQQGVELALCKGQENGFVNKEIDARGAADFYVAALAGGRGLAKATRSEAVLQNCVHNLNWYLASLRPAFARRAGDWMKEKLTALRRRDTGPALR